MRDEILKLVEDCIVKAERYYNAIIPRPVNIIFKRNGRVAGHSHYAKRELMFQLDLAEANREDFMQHTVPHEIAHWVQDWRYTNTKPHGIEWKRIMWYIYNIPADRCHTYDTSVTKVRQRRKQQRFEYSCKCMSHMISQTIHNKIQKGYSYTCKGCKTRIYFNP